MKLPKPLENVTPEQRASASERIRAYQDRMSSRPQLGIHPSFIKLPKHRRRIKR